MGKEDEEQPICSPDPPPEWETQQGSHSDQGNNHSTTVCPSTDAGPHKSEIIHPSARTPELSSPPSGCVLEAGWTECTGGFGAQKFHGAEETWREWVSPEQPGIHPGLQTKPSLPQTDRYKCQGRALLTSGEGLASCASPELKGPVPPSHPGGKNPCEGTKARDRP